MTLEQHYTPKQLSKLLGWSVKTFIREFRHEPGVLVRGSKVTTKRARKKTQLSIPQSVLNRVTNRWRVK